MIQKAKFINILGIETSCDETAAAVVADGKIIKSSIVASQNKLHEKYGGVVPEIASRAHIEKIYPVIKEAMEQKDAAAIREELGDLLFSTVNLSRYLGHESEELLNENIAKFMRRFQGLENRLHAEGRELENCSIDELEAVWQAVKTEERHRS